MQQKNQNLKTDIGTKIKFYRKQKNMSMQQLADAICKSKATVSKYEQGMISIDIETLYDIARALNIYVGQLLYLPVAQLEKDTAQVEIPTFFRGLSQFYLYMYDGRDNTLNRCVVDIVAKTDAASYQVIMYQHVKNLSEYRNCENVYIGTLKHYDTLSHLILQHKDTPIEQVMITVLASHLSNEQKWGMFFGLSTRPMFPCAAKALFSRTPLEENKDLYQKLILSKEDIRTMKFYNMMAVT